MRAHRFSCRYCGLYVWRYSRICERCGMRMRRAHFADSIWAAALGCLLFAAAVSGLIAVLTLGVARYIG